MVKVSLVCNSSTIVYEISLMLLEVVKTTAEMFEKYEHRRFLFYTRKSWRFEAKSVIIYEIAIHQERCLVHLYET